MIAERIDNYKEGHCWQYDVRLRNLDKDIKLAGLNKDTIDNLSCSNFRYIFVTNKKEQIKLKEFIKQHEWLGNLSQFTTHWFGCYLDTILAGAILFNVPNSFSKLLGDDTPKIERLISRGACISWSPKNLASSFLMWCIKYMVENTDFRLFTAYSDPQAKELGSIYQACNFFYLGQSSGTTARYVNPYTGKLVSDRFFRQKTSYKKYCKELGIEWQSNWMHPTGMCWYNMPKETEIILRNYSKKKQKEAVKTIVPAKHKYAYIRGRDKRETKKLKSLFLERNKVYPYPKIRGQ